MTSYREAGVDLDAADRHTESIAAAVTSTWASQVVGGFGGFAAGVRVPSDLTDPVLMLTTDGVGTKIEVARRAGSWDGIGFDLVAMCVDDLAAAGARPIGFVDYMAVGSLRPKRDRAIVASIAAACSASGCPLLGGETAEHPGVMEDDGVDLAGAAMGVVEAASLLSSDRVSEGDVVVGLGSPNLRANGFSLVRTILGDEAEALSEMLLEPSVIYSPAVLAAVETGGVHAAAHITGGGIAANLARALPDGLGASVFLDRWERPEVFRMLSSRGIDEEEMRRVFNLGVGFCLVVDRDMVQPILEKTASHDSIVIGEVGAGDGVMLL